MGSAPYGRFEVNKAKGKPTSIKVEIKQLMYYDLDANGTLDTMTDLRGLDPKTFIFIDNQIVQVEHTRGGGGASLANSLDRTQNFKFEAGKWRRVE